MRRDETCPARSPPVDETLDMVTAQDKRMR